MASRRWSSSARFGPDLEPLARHPIAEPAQHPRDARPQLGVVVGLGDVVLGDLVEQVGLRVRGVDRRQHDDRQVGARLDLARERQAVHARHQHVDDQEVGPGLRQAPQRLVAVARGRHLVAVHAELVGEDDEQVGVVVHDQDPRRGLAVRSGAAVHGRRISARIRRPQAPRGGAGTALRSGSSAAQPEPLRPRAPGGGDLLGRGRGARQLEPEPFASRREAIREPLPHVDRRREAVASAPVPRGPRPGRPARRARRCRGRRPRRGPARRAAASPTAAG